jgi:predicted Zn-dependent protease
VGRRLTRKQMKKDQFVTFFDRGIHWLNKNWRQAVIALGVVLVMAIGWWGVTAFLGSRTKAAAHAMSQALEIFQAPVGSAAPADATMKFATDAERLAAAEKAFQSVRSRFKFTPQARVAELFLAHVAVDRGDLTKAINLLTELTARRSDNPLVRLAMLDLIRLRIDRGEGIQMVGELEAMASGKDPRLPPDVALYELARIWEREGKPGEATKTYRKLVENFPDSPYLLEARQHLASGS